MVIFALLIVDGLLIVEAGGHPLHVGVKVWFTLPWNPCR